MIEIEFMNISAALRELEQLRQANCTLIEDRKQLQTQIQELTQLNQIAVASFQKEAKARLLSQQISEKLKELAHEQLFMLNWHEDRNAVNVQILNQQTAIIKRYEDMTGIECAKMGNIP